ncbi:MAG: hypothetical protein IJY87_02265 [Bacilli bacterium]|nr:hypothetical protein [Bacilli bacterium]
MKFEKIVQRHSYDIVFSSFLKDVYYELVKYFKNEEIVFEALFNTKIVSVENVYDYMKDNDLLEDYDTLVTNSDMKRSSGVCQSIPEIIYNPQTNTYNIVNVKRSVAVVNLDLSRTHSKATLIHELCHLIKSYYNEYTIEGNILISHSGLIESHYELSFDGTKVTKKLIKEIGVGLEEGLTSVDEEEITRNIVDSEYTSSGYGVVNSVARNLLQIPDIRDIIINAQIYHDKSEIYDKLGIEDYIILEELANKLYELNLEMFSQAFEPEKMTETAERIKEILRTEYAPLKSKMESNFKRS